MSAQPTTNETQVQTTNQANQAPTQQGTNVVFGQPNAQGVVFYQIIDLITEVQRGNFLPALHSLRYELIPKDFIDHTGYNFLHYATSQNQLPIVLILLDHFKFDVNIRSGTNQTALMIACHYGNVELIRVLLERGALVNVQDDTKFSPLLYSVKAKHVPQIFYLLHHNESIHEVDANGCSAIHWAAYTNNVFFLQVLNRLGLNLQTTDGTGLTPLERAIQGESFQVIEYLVDRVHTSLPANLKVDEIKNNDIKIIINRKFFPTAWEKFQDSAVLFFRRRSRALTFIIYFLLWLLAMIFYRQEVMHKGFGYTIDLVYFITSLYFIGFSYFYIMKSAGGPPKKFSYESLNMSTESDESLTSTASSFHRVMDSAPKQNFDALDKLIQGPHAATVIHDESANQNQGFASFLHEIAWLFEVKNYKELQKFDTRAFCAECLTRKNPRSAHPKESRTCIDNFHHYSYCLGRSVDSSNHMHYVLMLTVQTVQFTLMIFGIWAAYWEEVKHGNLVAFEVGYLVGHKNGAFNATVYWFFLVLSIYNLIFFLVEIYGICKNLTWYEIFNTPDCTYLHQVRQDTRGQVVKGYHNPFDKGIVKNVFSYFQRIIQH